MCTYNVLHFTVVFNPKSIYFCEWHKIGFSFLKIQLNNCHKQLNAHVNVCVAMYLYIYVQVCVYVRIYPYIMGMYGMCIHVKCVYLVNNTFIYICA